MAVSCFFYGQDGTTLTEEINMIVWTSLFGVVQPMIVAQLFSRAEPPLFDLDQEMKKATTSARRRSRASLGIISETRERQESRISLASVVHFFE